MIKICFNWIQFFEQYPLNSCTKYDVKTLSRTGDTTHTRTHTWKYGSQVIVMISTSLFRRWEIWKFLLHHSEVKVFFTLLIEGWDIPGLLRGTPPGKRHISLCMCVSLCVTVRVWVPLVPLCQRTPRFSRWKGELAKLALWRTPIRACHSQPPITHTHTYTYTHTQTNTRLLW